MIAKIGCIYTSMTHQRCVSVCLSASSVDLNWQHRQQNKHTANKTLKRQCKRNVSSPIVISTGMKGESRGRKRNCVIQGGNHTKLCVCQLSADVDCLLNAAAVVVIAALSDYLEAGYATALAAAEWGNSTTESKPVYSGTTRPDSSSKKRQISTFKESLWKVLWTSESVHCRRQIVLQCRHLQVSFTTTGLVSAVSSL